MTRPLASAKRFVSALPAHLATHVSPVYAPLMEIVPTGAARPDIDPRGVLFTSANGVRHAGKVLDIPAYCVGPATTRAARRAGWAAEERGASADDLVESLLRNPVASPLLHFSGQHLTGNVAARLTSAGMPTSQVAVYDQPLRDLSEAAQTLLCGEAPVLVPLFSPRTAGHFVSQAQRLETSYVVALSQTVADSLGARAAKDVSIASRPTSEGMVEGLGQVVRRLLG